MKSIFFTIALLCAPLAAQAQTLTTDPIYDLSTTREDIKRLCTTCVQISNRDTLSLWGPFQGLKGLWTIVFDSTGQHRESDWIYDSYYDTTALPTVLSRLTELYGKPMTEGGYVNRATWHIGETVIFLIYRYGRDEVSVYWRHKSDMPIRWVALATVDQGRIDIETGRQFPPSIFDLTVTRQDLIQMCPKCTTFVDRDSVILRTTIAGVQGSYTLVFDSHDELRESNWTSGEWKRNSPDSPSSKHRGPDALKAIITELSSFYGKPRIEEGPIKKVSWHQGETVATVTYLEKEGEIGVYWRYESDMPLRWITSQSGDTPVHINVNTGLPAR